MKRSRTFAVGGALTVCAALLGACSSGTETPGGGTSVGADCKIAPSVTLRVMNAGGQETTAINEAFNAPFTQRTGVKVVMESPNDLGKLQAMVQSGGDVVDLYMTDGATFETAKKQNLLQPLTYDAISPAPAIDGALTEHGMAFEYYSTIMAWDTSAASGQKLTSWADFFDTTKFPGRRALADNPQDTLPAALLADGVPKNQLYPLDIDRAFAYLDKHKGDIAVWWSAGSQPPQLLKDKEIAYTSSWNSRIVKVAKDQGSEYTFDQGLLGVAYVGMVKGATHVCEANAYLHEISLPQNQAKMASGLSVTGSAKDVEKYLDKSLDPRWFSTTSVNLAGGVPQDFAWWADNGAAVQQRWEEFKLAR